MRTRPRSGALIAIATALACDEGLHPTPAPTTCPQGFIGICGTVVFQGQLPESTDRIFVVAFDTFPRNANDLFKFKPALPPTLPNGGPPYAYTPERRQVPWGVTSAT